jgi:hypothetical protein
MREPIMQGQGYYNQLSELQARSAEGADGMLERAACGGHDRSRAADDCGFRLVARSQFNAPDSVDAGSID